MQHAVLHLPKNDSYLIGRDVGATMFGRSDLTEVQRHCSGDDTSPKTSNDATNNHHREMNCAGLNGCADAKHAHSNETRPSSSEFVVGGTGEQRKAKELTGGEDGSDQPSLSGRRVVESLLETRRDVDGAEDADVVPERKCVSYRLCCERGPVLPPEDGSHGEDGTAEEQPATHLVRSLNWCFRHD